MAFQVAGITTNEEVAQYEDALRALGFVSNRRVDGRLGLVPTRGMAQEIFEALPQALKAHCVVEEVPLGNRECLQLFDQTISRLRDGSDLEVDRAFAFLGPLGDEFDASLRTRQDWRDRIRELRNLRSAADRLSGFDDTRIEEAETVFENVVGALLTLATRLGFTEDDIVS